MLMMLLNQDQDLLADLSIAICSSLFFKNFKFPSYDSACCIGDAILGVQERFGGGDETRGWGEHKSAVSHNLRFPEIKYNRIAQDYNRQTTEFLEALGRCTATAGN